MTKKEYEKQLKKIQKEHLRRVREYQGGFKLPNDYRFGEDQYWQPCVHDQCGSCHGTGVKFDGSPCIHNLYCSCPKCSPQCGTGTPAFNQPGYGDDLKAWSGTTTGVCRITSGSSCGTAYFYATDVNWSYTTKMPYAITVGNETLTDPEDIKFYQKNGITPSLARISRQFKTLNSQEGS